MSALLAAKAVTNNTVGYVFRGCLTLPRLHHFKRLAFWKMLTLFDAPDQGCLAI